MRPWARIRAGLALLAALVLLALPGVARAEPVVLLLSSRDAPVAPSAELLEDPSRGLTIRDVVEGPASARFARVTRANLGYQRAAFWVRFSVLRETGAPPRWVVRLTKTPSRAELYTPQEGGDFGVKVSGVALPFGVREIADTRIAFWIEPPPSRVTTYYLRLEFDNTAQVAPELYPEATYRGRLAVESLACGLYYGAILALIAYNAILFLVTRDRASLMYIFFELALVLHQSSLDKLLFQHLWPGSPLWARHADVVFLCATIFGGIGFVRSFLSLGEMAPRLARAYAWLMVGVLFSGAVGAATMLPALRAGTERHAPLLLTLLGVFVVTCALFLVATGVVLARRLVPGTTTFIAAWSLLVIGATARFLDVKGIAQNLDSLTLMKVASLAEATLLSLALARRVSAIQRESARAQERLSRARDERLAALGRLVAGFAHELGNPLNFVLGGGTEAVARVEAAESLLGPERRVAGGVGDELGAARKALDLVVNGSERMKRILDSLRCYMRSSAVDPVANDVGAAVRSTLALAAPLLERTGTRVELDAAAVPAVDARPGEIEQVFMNLVVNACQAMRGAGGELSITVSAEGGRVLVAFEDTGPGIPKSQREAVFEPFFTTREGGGGTGLGLYVSNDIVTRNGGELRIEESVKGTRFVVSLPGARP